ncbi:MAG: hypothetical protein JO182_20570 [Acidobacteriaceae bacterium]|nr:hypothetical protein [Acidobacteriaceae bacterium]MBV9677812.1 hypothetical protein [Acidobacteriaceae bacterium]
MTSFLIDINVWLAMTWNEHPQHAHASLWYSSINNASLWFCRLTMLGFLRLLTNSKVMGNSTVTVNEALKLYERWMHDPRVELVPEPRGMEKAFREALIPFALQPATKAIADCYLVGFAEASGAHLVTFDKGLASSAQARKVPVILIRSV